MPALGPLKPIWRYFGYDEPNYTYMPHGRKLVGELAAPQSAARPHPHALSAGHRRRHAGAEVGIDQRLHRGCRGQARLRLDDHRPHLRHLRAGRAKPFVEIGFMPEALSTQAPAVRSDRGREPNDGHAAGPIRPRTTASGGAGLPVGAAFGRAVWQREVESLVLGGLERARHRLLERHARGVQPALRLYGRAVKRALPAAAWEVPPPPGRAAPKAAAFLRQFLEHCAEDRRPARFHHLPRQGRADGGGRPRADGPARTWRTCRSGIEIVASFPQFRNLPIILSESDPGGLRGLLGARLSAECLSQRPAVPATRRWRCKHHPGAGDRKA